LVIRSHVCFTRPFLIPDLAIDPILHDEYRFLGNLRAYADYYLAHEISHKGHGHSTVDIEGLGTIELKPLNKRITLGGFWKSFRIPIKKEKEQADSILFQFLPLKMSLGLNQISARSSSRREMFEMQRSAYLFPFGICLVNCDFYVGPRENFDEWSYELTNDDFLDLMKKLPRATIFSKNNTNYNFRNFVGYFGENLVKKLFKYPASIQLGDMHTTYFLSSDSILYFNPDKLDLGRETAVAIAALMSGSTILDMNTKSPEELRLVLREILKGRRDGELLLFNEDSSLLYPSPLWLDALKTHQGTAAVKAKTSCMYHNYLSFINITLALEKYLEYIIANKENIPKEKIDTIRMGLQGTFLNKAIKSSHSFYFKTRFEPIAKTLGIADYLTTVEKL
jgi:hypothetical protein